MTRLWPLILILIVTTTTYVPGATLPEWVTSEKIRAAFIQDWGSFDLDVHFRELEDAGFNLVMPTHGYAPAMGDSIERVRTLSSKHGLH